MNRNVPFLYTNLPDNSQLSVVGFLHNFSLIENPSHLDKVRNATYRLLRDVVGQRVRPTNWVDATRGSSGRLVTVNNLVNNDVTAWASGATSSQHAPIGAGTRIFFFRASGDINVSDGNIGGGNRVKSAKVYNTDLWMAVVPEDVTSVYVTRYPGTGGGLHVAHVFQLGGVDTTNSVRISEKLPYLEYKTTRYDADGATVEVTAGANTPRKFKIADLIGGANPGFTMQKTNAIKGDIPVASTSILGTALFVEPTLMEGTEEVQVQYSGTLRADEGNLQTKPF